MRHSRKLHDDFYELDDYHDTCEDTIRKPYTIIKSTKQCFPLNKEDYDEYDGCDRHDACDKKQAHSKHRKKSFVKRACNEVFKCKNCRRFIGPPPSGGRHRNHCPFCLFSLHVDGDCSGDRLSACGSRMEPIGSFQRVNGEYVLVHRCRGCGFERFNRIAADDDFALVLALPALAPRTKHHL